MNDPSWLTIVLAFIAASVPVTIGFLLTRKGANKKLEIDESNTDATVFTAQTKAYQDLLDRANAAVVKAEAAAAAATADRADLLKRVGELERAKTSQEGDLTKTNSNLDKVRKLFQRYIARVGIPMTPEEQRIFDDTVPHKMKESTL